MEILPNNARFHFLETILPSKNRYSYSISAKIFRRIAKGRFSAVTDNFLTYFLSFPARILSHFMKEDSVKYE